MGTQLSLPQKGGTAPPIFGPCLLWPNGWMDQEATWYGDIHRPGHIMLDRDPLKRSTAPNFRLCLLWPNGWMDRDATWYEGRPRLRLHCVAWGPIPTPLPKEAQPANFRRMSIVGFVAKRSPFSAVAEYMFNIDITLR